MNDLIHAAKYSVFVLLGTVGVGILTASLYL